MKKTKRTLVCLLTLALLLAGLPMYGISVKAESSGDYEYEVNEDGIGVTITKYVGNGGDVTIPSEIGGKKVVSIGEGVFCDFNSLTSLSIPESVVNIGDYAFWGCSSLNSINIPNKVTSIGFRVFKYCSNLTSISIPNGVESIGREAFCGCSSLTSVNIPSSVTKIGESAFSDCNGLESIKVNEGNPTYDSRDNCNAIIETEHNELIHGCKNTIIPNGVTSIGSEAFADCSSLTSIRIPSSVAKIWSGTFNGCSSLESIKVDEGNPTYDSGDNCNAIIETGSNTLIQGCKNTIVPDGVMCIGFDAFEGHSGLTSMTIPNSVTSIWDSAFAGCSGLKSVTIPNSVTRIGASAFAGCSDLKSITIPNSVTDISVFVFDECSSLESIKVDKGNLKYDSRNNCNAIIETERNRLEYGCKNTIIPDGVTCIGSHAFYGCSGLTSITIPKSVTSIWSYAFGKCGLTNLEIPEGVASIDSYAFYGCSSLKSVIIPKSVTDIGYYQIFYDCSSLENIEVDEGNLKYDSRDNCNAIIETESNELIQGCKNTIIPNGVTSIGSEAFANCSSLTSINIPSNVVSIGGYAFEDCRSLTSVNIADSVTSIGEAAFRRCSSLTDIRIPSSVVSIEWETFYGCSSLTNITIPPSVKSIENGALGYYNIEVVGDSALELKVSDLIIHGVSGSAAETYAKDNGFVFQVISDDNPPQGGDSKMDISKASITLSKSSYIYDGWQKKPAVTVKLNGKTLKADTDYMVIYSSNIDIGTAKVVIIGKGNYTGNKTVNFTIVKASDKPDSSITCKKTLYKFTYGQKAFKINASSKGKLAFTSSNSKVVTVDKNTGNATIKGTGVAIITVKAGNKSVNVTVKISPKKALLKSTKTGKGRKLTVKWAKDKNATGYQVQISYNKNLKKIVKQKNVSKNSFTFTKLKDGKKYYVRVRSYKKSGKETLYGAWSKVKQSGKVKK